MYSDSKVIVSSPQLLDRCRDHLSWYGADERPLGKGDSSTVKLDDDGNAFAVALAGPHCAPGKSLVTADLEGRALHHVAHGREDSFSTAHIDEGDAEGRHIGQRRRCSRIGGPE